MASIRATCAARAGSSRSSSASAATGVLRAWARFAADGTDLDELIGNLLDNAVRHASRHVRIVGTIDKGDARRVRIEVADDGPGIPAADRERATAPGVRLDERGGGKLKLRSVRRPTLRIRR